MTPDATSFGGETHIGLAGEPQCRVAPGGYRWNGGTNDLDAVWGLRDCWGAWPNGISADGKVIVGSTGPYTAPVLHGMIWTQETGTVLLQNYIENLGADIGDFSWLGVAMDVSDDGKTIVGASPGEGAWVITLPGAADPAAALRAGTGEVVLSGGVPVHLPVGKAASGGTSEVEKADTPRPTGPVQIEMK